MSVRKIYEKHSNQYLPFHEGQDDEVRMIASGSIFKELYEYVYGNVSYRDYADPEVRETFNQSIQDLYEKSIALYKRKQGRDRRNTAAESRDEENNQ